jgi:hypothetical protein
MDQAQKLHLLEHAFMNQLETDFQDQDYEAMSEMINILLKNPVNQDILYQYLGDSAQENLMEGKTNCRY